MSAGEWVFEGADPEVGIFGDLVLHACDKNVDEEPATEVSVSHFAAIDKTLVNEITTFACPACKATTTVTEQHPADWFVEPGREPEMFEVVHSGVVTVEL